MTVAVHDHGDAVVINLAGDLDLVSEGEVVATLIQTASKPNRTAIRVDLTDVQFIDSSGLRALLVGAQAALDRGVAFGLDISGGGLVARLLTVAGLDEHFNVTVH